MSEADNPNNQSFPEPADSRDNSAADLPDATEASEDAQIVNFSDLPSFEEVVQLRQAQAISDSPITAAITAEVDDGMSETSDISERRTKDADWFALAQKMRQRNRRLLDQVTELRQALREKQEELHVERSRSRDHETLITQQSEELNTAQEQLTRLFQALESSHQASQRQQILIETLSEQLQSSQERVAQLERECALIQQRYNEQSHQLLQAANTCRELRTRLHRQQRQTLQFKVALEKSLEMPSSSNLSRQQPPPQKSSTASSSTFPKAQPIKPWSTEQELLEDQSTLDPIWKSPVRLDLLPTVHPQGAEPPEINQFKEIDFSSTQEVPDLAEKTVASSSESTETELELEQQLLAEMSSLAEAAGLSDLAADISNTQSHLSLDSGTYFEETDELEPVLSKSEEMRSRQDIDELEIEAQRLDEELQEDSASRDAVKPNDVVLPQSNWPSPVLYPLRPPKRRKSLASIELPSFPRYRPI